MVLGVSEHEIFLISLYTERKHLMLSAQDGLIRLDLYIHKGINIY